MSCNCNNKKGGNTNDPTKKKATPELKLQVHDILGSNNIRFKVINTGAGTADLNKFDLKLEVVAATASNNQPIQGVEVYSTVSMRPNSRIANTIAELVANKQKLAPSESIEIEKFFLDASANLDAATISCKIINPEREEVDQKTITWKAQASQITINIINVPNPVYSNGKVKFQFSCKNISQVPFTTEQLMGTFTFYDTAAHFIKLIHQEAISITPPIHPNDVIPFSIEIQDPKA